MHKIILTGGTGLIGKRLTERLIEKKYNVRILSRNPSKANEYKWNLDENYIDEAVFDEATAIIHLAGASIADKRWTTERKQEILESRIKSTQLLHHYLATHSHQLKTFIAASAVGFYGNRNDEILNENSNQGTGFLSEVCQKWETEADKIATLPIAFSKIRIGVVFSKQGGALPKIDLPIRFGIAAYIGDGTQYVPWIHIDDLCSIFIYLLENQHLNGTYHACAPDSKTNKEISKAIGKVLQRPSIPLPVPAYLLEALMGEMASMLLMSTRCSSQKIMDKGFIFQYPTLEKALLNIYQKN